MSKLILENGSIYKGTGFGKKVYIGEIVFDANDWISGL